MTDDLPRGLGAIPSPPDPRDWPAEQLHAMLGTDAAGAALPSRYIAPAPRPPIMDQGQTGRCVAFGSAWIKRYQDLRDTGPFEPDTADFFFSIGGDDATGAVPRYALAKMAADGYPEAGNAHADRHRLGSYYNVPTTAAGIKAAIAAVAGPVGLGLSWSRSWFTPRASGVLPAPTTFAGGHWIAADGWDDSLGVHLDQSWGDAWGVSGTCWLPYAYLSSAVEAWATTDVIEARPSPTGYRIAIARGATIRLARVTAETPPRISGWDKPTVWAKPDSGAPTDAPRILRGTVSGQALVARVTAGLYKGRFIRIGDGVTSYRPAAE